MCESPFQAGGAPNYDFAGPEFQIAKRVGLDFVTLLLRRRRAPSIMALPGLLLSWITQQDKQYRM